MFNRIKFNPVKSSPWYSPMHRPLVLPRHWGTVAEHAAYCYFEAAFSRHAHQNKLFHYHATGVIETKTRFVKCMLECKETSDLLLGLFDDFLKITDPQQLTQFMHALCLSVKEDKKLATKQSSDVANRMLNQMLVVLSNPLLGSAFLQRKKAQPLIAPTEMTIKKSVLPQDSKESPIKLAEEKAEESVEKKLLPSKPVLFKPVESVSNVEPVLNGMPVLNEVTVAAEILALFFG